MLTVYLLTKITGDSSSKTIGVFERAADAVTSVQCYYARKGKVGKVIHLHGRIQIESPDDYGWTIVPMIVQSESVVI